MNVILISNSPQVGGGNQSLRLLACGLRDKGHGVRAVIPAQGPMTELCEGDRLEYQVQEIFQPSWRRPFGTLADYRRWTRFLREPGASIIHSNDMMTARSISLAARRLKVPVVCHIRFPPGKEATAWVFRGLPKPSAFIFNSQAMQDECGEDILRVCPRAAQFVVHNAVDLNRFQPRFSERPKCQQVGILANLIPIKGHKDFLQMAEIVKGRGHNVEFQIIGGDIHDTGYGAELEELAIRLGVRDVVEFVGHCSNVPERVNELDVLVCASHIEPFGRCLIEAMACEKPVVATRVGGIPEVVEDGRTGILVPPKSPEELAAAVERLLIDADLRKSFGRRGRERALEQFSAENHVAEIIAIYRQVLGSDEAGLS